MNNPGKTNWSGRISTVGLFVRTSLNQRLLTVPTLVTFLQNYHNEEVNRNEPSPSVRVPWTSRQNRLAKELYRRWRWDHIFGPIRSRFRRGSASCMLKYSKGPFLMCLVSARWCYLLSPCMLLVWPSILDAPTLLPKSSRDCPINLKALKFLLLFSFTPAAIITKLFCSQFTNGPIKLGFLSLAVLSGIWCLKVRLEPTEERRGEERMIQRNKEIGVEALPNTSRHKWLLSWTKI